MSMVAEPSEYQYGAEAFEQAMREDKLSIPDVKAPMPPKIGKSR